MSESKSARMRRVGVGGEEKSKVQSDSIADWHLGVAASVAGSCTEQVEEEKKEKKEIGASFYP